MAKLEKFKPQLKAGHITPQGDKLLFETDSPSDQVILPIENVDFLLLCTGEHTVGEIIEIIYHRKGAIQFKTIYKTLLFLKERGFLENGDQLELPIDDNHAREVNFFSLHPMFEIYIGKRIFNEKNQPHVFYFMAMASILLTIFSLGSYSFEVFNFSFLRIDDSYLKGVLFIIIGSSLLLSLKNIYKCLLLIFLTGRAYNFSLVFNGLAFYFRVKSDSLFLISNRFYLTLFHLAVAVCYFPLIRAFYLFVPESFYFNEAMNLGMLLFLLSINPFQESEASNMLRSLFNDDTLNKVSNYMPHKSLLSLINPSDRLRDNNLYFFFTHFACLWAVAFYYFQYAITHKHFGAVIQNIKSADAGEQLAGLFIIILCISVAVGVAINTFRLMYLALFQPITHMVFNYLRKIKSQKMKDFNTKEIIRTLEELPLFSYFSRDNLKSILDSSVIREYKQASPVIIQGDLGTHLYTILSGSLQVRRRLPSGRVKTLGEIHPPSIFGEIAVIEESPRAADVVTISPSVIIETPAQVLRQIAEDSQYVRQLDGFRNAIMVNQFFTAAPIFRELSESIVQLFTQKGKIESFEKDEVLFKQGDQGDGFYLLLRGSVGVSVNGRPVSRIQQGGFFGEISMIADVPRTATLYAIESSQVLKIGRDAFWEILSHDINMAMLIESVGEMRIREDIEIIRAGSARVA